MEKVFVVISFLSETVLPLLLPFPTTYLCETGFFSSLVIKFKYSRLVIEDDLCCALAKTAPKKEAISTFQLTLAFYAYCCKI